MGASLTNCVKKFVELVDGALSALVLTFIAQGLGRKEGRA